jgi:GT2 family glycosyltransferase
VDTAGAFLASRGLLRTAAEPHRGFGEGITVIVPERDSPGLLRECLAACRAAAQRLAEPCQVVVVVNGCEPKRYEDLRVGFPEVEFLFFPEPLGFSRAIERGLAAARYDWVYLLNSDMVLEPAALAEVARCRAPHVFAAASQIFFRDPARRREETGWTDFEMRNGWVEIFDVPPETSDMVRGNFYAGGGASLFRKSLLLRFLDPSHPYDPFYWEDVEWGSLAWRFGYESLFCPASRAWHYHRATVGRFYSPLQIERIFRVNGYRFQMRNLSNGNRNRELFRWLLNVDGPCLRLLLAPREVRRTLRARFLRRSLPFPELALAGRRARYHPHQAIGRSERPCVIVVTPYVL